MFSVLISFFSYIRDIYDQYIARASSMNILSSSCTNKYKLATIINTHEI